MASIETRPSKVSKIKWFGLEDDGGLKIGIELFNNKLLTFPFPENLIMDGFVNRAFIKVHVRNLPTRPNKSISFCQLFYRSSGLNSNDVGAWFPTNGFGMVTRNAVDKLGTALHDVQFQAESVSHLADKVINWTKDLSERIDELSVGDKDSRRVPEGTPVISEDGYDEIDLLWGYRWKDLHKQYWDKRKKKIYREMLRIILKEPFWTGDGSWRGGRYANFAPLIYVSHMLKNISSCTNPTLSLVDMYERYRREYKENYWGPIRDDADHTWQKCHAVLSTFDGDYGDEIRQYVKRADKGPEGDMDDSLYEGELLNAWVGNCTSYNWFEQHPLDDKIHPERNYMDPREAFRGTYVDARTTRPFMDDPKLPKDGNLYVPIGHSIAEAIAEGNLNSSTLNLGTTRDNYNYNYRTPKQHATLYKDFFSPIEREGLLSLKKNSTNTWNGRLRKRLKTN